MLLLFVVITCVGSIQFAPETVTRKVASVTPSFGSVEGGTRLVIKGEGFSVNYANGGNKVMIGDAECKTVESSGFGAIDHTVLVVWCQAGWIYGAGEVPVRWRNHRHYFRLVFQGYVFVNQVGVILQGVTMVVVYVQKKKNPKKLTSGWSTCWYCTIRPRHSCPT